MSCSTPVHSSTSISATPTLSTTALVNSHVVGSPYAIIASGAVNPDYAISYIVGNLTVTPAPLTITANDQTKVYGAPVPTLSYTIGGFVADDNSGVVSGVSAIATTAPAGVGAYPITIAVGTLSAIDYRFPAAGLIDGTLTVTPAPLTISAVSITMHAGQSVPALTAVYAGFVNGDTPASLTSSPELQTAATPSSAPEEYPILVGGAHSPNYTITYVPGTLNDILAPTTVESVSIRKIKLGKDKRIEQIVVQFSESLDAATAQGISSYILTKLPNHKTGKPVLLSRASYNAASFTVTLLTRRALARGTPLELTIEAAAVRDAFGRELDGNDSGQSGANFSAYLGKAGRSAQAIDFAPESGLQGPT